MQCQLPTSQKEKKRIDEYVSRRPSKINYSSPRTKKKKNLTRFRHLFSKLLNNNCYISRKTPLSFFVVAEQHGQLEI
jgi:hypothetical protein